MKIAPAITLCVVLSLASLMFAQVQISLIGVYIEQIWLCLAVICALGAILALYYILAGWASVTVVVRALLSVIPIGALGAILVWVLLQINGLDDSLLKAMIAAIVVATGWVVGFVTTEWRAMNSEQERRRDFVKAAVSEIRLIVRLSDKADWGKVKGGVEDAFDKDKKYEPYVFVVHEYATLARLSEQIEILEENQIVPFMDLMHILQRLEKMEVHINSEDFKKLDVKRRKEGVLRFLRLHEQLGPQGRATINALNARPFYGVFDHLAEAIK